MTHKVGLIETKPISREPVVCLNGRELICGGRSTRSQMQRVGYLVAPHWQQTVCQETCTTSKEHLAAEGNWSTAVVLIGYWRKDFASVISRESEALGRAASIRDVLATIVLLVPKDM